MGVVAFACALLVVMTTLVHYEALGGLNAWLAASPMRNRVKVVAALLGVFLAHIVEITLYGAAIYLLTTHFPVGRMSGAESTLTTCFYFSTETYTALGMGDLMPVGPIRMLAGVEALNGLLLIGWSASFLYICMERFWAAPHERRAKRRRDSAGDDGPRR
ncbi:MAG: potassium channel family protein [Proteobacteria bacterium]|nr:potassium channel family protein [Pseudomonadota bacterium]